jgi:putative transcriptional regulator
MRKQSNNGVRNAVGERRHRVGERIVGALASFVEALENGEKISEKFTCRKMVLDLRPVRHDPASVKAIRNQLNVSQAVFAQLLGVKPSTIQSWEQGRQTPGEMACRFLDEISDDPEYWRKRIMKGMRARC